MAVCNTGCVQPLPTPDLPAGQRATVRGHSSHQSAAAVAIAPAVSAEDPHREQEHSESKIGNLATKDHF